VSARKLARHLPAGGRVALGDGAGSPVGLAAHLAEAADEAGGISLLLGWCLRPPPFELPHHAIRDVRAIMGGYGVRSCPTRCPTRLMRKTSVDLDDEQAARLARLARELGRSQADVLREAIATYQPRSSQDRDFALAAGFPRVDEDARPISEIPKPELLEGFGM